MRRVGIYSRISADPEGRAAGVERQEEDARGLAERHGWEVVGEPYRDNDVSATKARRRPAWERLLADLEAGRVDAVVAYSSSRLYRRPRDLQRLIDLAARRDVAIETVVSGRVDLSTADGRLTAGLLAQIDQAEAERTSERLRRAFVNGKAPGGSRRAFGYRRDWQVDEREAALVREAAHRVISGESPYRVCADWNARGVRTPYGGLWRPSKLARVLRGRHLAGGQRGRPAVLSDDEHRVLRAALDAPRPRRDAMRDARGRAASPGRPSGRRYAANGVLRCGVCDDRMTGYSGHYTCPQGHVGIKATPAERHIVGLIVVRTWPSFEEHPEPAGAIDPADLEALRLLDERQAEVEEQMADPEGPVSPRAAARVLARLEERRAEAQARIRQATPAVAPPSREELVRSLEDVVESERWDRRELNEAEVARLQDAIRAHVERVRVLPAAVRGRRVFDPRRLEIAWR